MIYMLKNIKVNMHLIELCNFHCKYCFAHFENHKKLNKENWIKIIDNCVASGIVKEINFAGGEPMLCSYLTDLAEYAAKKGIKCSLITNGSLMTKEWIIKYAGLFTTIGISIDSFSDTTMKSIGRCTTNGKTISGDKIVKITKWIKVYHPDVRIKFNTVVNAYNKNELPAKFFTENNITPNRWKLLKMCPFADECHNNYDLQVSDDEYAAFVAGNLEILGKEFTDFNTKYEISDHTEVVAEKDINGAYIMIDAGGYLVDDTQNTSYTRIINCETEIFSEGLKKLTFYEDTYNSRYTNYSKRNK